MAPIDDGSILCSNVWAVKGAYKMPVHVCVFICLLDLSLLTLLHIFTSSLLTPSLPRKWTICEQLCLCFFSLFWSLKLVKMAICSRWLKMLALSATDEGKRKTWEIFHTHRLRLLFAVFANRLNLILVYCLRLWLHQHMSVNALVR